ncbi:MAG: hypothetical protein KUG78_03270 [Kangiellaceae bacterium]|nr:hypothetical protein [Kangiellaceae bacterium]
MTNTDFLKSAAIGIAHKYTSMKKLNQAIPFWNFGHSKFKEYFMNSYAERFIAMEETKLAHQIWA